MSIDLGAAATGSLRVVRAQGDAFESLFRSEYARLVRIADRVLADRAEAEDVAQEVFINFHGRHAPDARYAAAWLYKAAAHSALNRLRGRKRRENREMAEAANAEPDLDPAQVVEVNAQREAIRLALGRMAAKPAAVLILRSSGLSYQEVATALGVGVGQVGTLLRRAEAALRKEVTRESSV